MKSVSSSLPTFLEMVKESDFGDSSVLFPILVPLPLLQATSSIHLPPPIPTTPKSNTETQGNKNETKILSSLRITQLEKASAFLLFSQSHQYLISTQRYF